jgi:hypothetical protein
VADALTDYAAAKTSDVTGLVIPDATAIQGAAAAALAAYPVAKPTDVGIFTSEDATP